jgi:hypothetical protein
MNPTLFEISVAAVMVAVSVGLLLWFWRDLGEASERRTMDMLAGAGVHSVPPANEYIMQDARKRCRRCPSEGLCERWLAGSVDGDNSFCPNAQIFRKLANAA